MAASKKTTKRSTTKRARKPAAVPGMSKSSPPEASTLQAVAVSQPQAFMIDTSNDKFKAVLMYLLKDAANIDAVHHLIQR